MDVASLRLVMWGTSGLVLVGLIVVTLALARLFAHHGVWYWLLVAVALGLSGPVVRALVHIWTATPTLRVVPGGPATWTPAVLGLVASILIWRSKFRLRQSSA